MKVENFETHSVVFSTGVVIFSTISVMIIAPIVLIFFYGAFHYVYRQFIYFNFVEVTRYFWAWAIRRKLERLRVGNWWWTDIRVIILILMHHELLLFLGALLAIIKSSGSSEHRASQVEGCEFDPGFKPATSESLMCRLDLNMYHLLLR